MRTQWVRICILSDRSTFASLSLLNYKLLNEKKDLKVQKRSDLAALINALLGELTLNQDNCYNIHAFVYSDLFDPLVPESGGQIFRNSHALLHQCPLNPLGLKP